MKTKGVAHFIVYQAVNVVNGKRYIGATKHSLRHRRRAHENDARSGRAGCRVFNMALRKYSETGFRWEILCRLDTYEAMMAEEVRLIAERKPEYNLTRGGQGIIGLERTAIWRQRISDANKGRQLTPEQRRRWLANQRHAVKSICCLDDGLWFSSVKAAARHYSVKAGAVSAALNKRGLSAGGRHFAYATCQLSVEERQRLREETDRRRQEGQERKRVAKSRAVRCYTHGNQVFPSGRVAAKAFGITPGRVVQLCREGGVTSAGVGFMYADAEHPPTKRALTPEQRADGKRRQFAAQERTRARQRKAVFCATDGQMYPSVHAAGRAYGFRATRVSTAIYRGKPTGGLLFSFAAAGA